MRFRELPRGAMTATRSDMMRLHQVCRALAIGLHDVPRGALGCKEDLLGATRVKWGAVRYHKVS